MLPNQSLSINPVVADYECPLIALSPFSTIDYELGAAAIGDPSMGLMYQIWTATVNEYNRIVLTSENNDVHVLIEVPENVKKISFAFDQNMRPYVAYFVNDDSYLYWFDTVENDYVTTLFSNCSYPALTLDERRSDYILDSDVVFAYVFNGKLCYRLQRDRYSVEYVLDANFNGRLITIGMNTAHRLQFSIMYDAYGSIAPAPTTTPAPSHTVTPTVTPTPSTTVSVTPTLTPTQTLTPTPTITLSVTPTNTPPVTPTATVTPTMTPVPSPTVTPTVTPTISITPTITITPNPTVTPTITITPTITVTPTSSSEPTSGVDTFSSDTSANYNVSGSWTFASDKISTSSSSAAFIRNGFTQSDCYVECDTGSSYDSQLFIRYVDSANNYHLRISDDSGGHPSHNILLYVVTANTFSEVANSGNLTWANGVSKTIKLEASGTTINAYLDGTLIISYTNGSNWTTAGKIGIGNAIGTVRVDELRWGI